LCANADGTDKYKPFVIDKSPNPRYFKCIKCNRLSAIYETSSKAWMTTVLFQQWLKEFDLKIAGRKLLNQYESGNDDKLNVLNAIKFIVQAWKEVLSETACNCFRHIGILPVQNNKEPTINKNDNELMEEIKANIEAFNFRNAMDFEVYINYAEEEDTYEVLND
ncbi:10771_t:CDS:2, partial [Dentiscutata erythropus]